MAGRPPAEPGSWMCPDLECGNINFPRRMTCNKCQLPKPKDARLVNVENTIGKAVAEKSKGLFSAADWQCAMCGNVNWARREDCNVCNYKRDGKTEVRKGAGGGFNERDGVEYVRREEDDDYDEFGRKKKKKGAVVPAPVSVQESVEEETKEGEKIVMEEVEEVVVEEEEEEDDDDVDISKYQLLEDDEIVDNDTPIPSKSNKDDKVHVLASPQKSPTPRSRSPPRARSRSPIGHRSRSPIGHRSRSPIGHRSRSPIGHRSRSPVIGHAPLYGEGVGAHTIIANRDRLQDMLEGGIEMEREVTGHQGDAIRAGTEEIDQDLGVPLEE
eukprot:Ihof_evm1s507 gene=Ihof_evmTU1s507